MDEKELTENEKKKEYLKSYRKVKFLMKNMKFLTKL